MRIGIVAHELEGQRTGVGRYLEGLLRGAAEIGTDDEFVLFLKGEPIDLGLEGHLEIHFDRRPKAHPILWEQLRLPRLIRRERLDAVFSPGYSLPEATGLPGIVALHDLSFECLGSEFGFKERWRRRLLARRAAHRAARLLTGIPRIAREIAATYGVAEDKIGLVPLGVEPAPEPSADALREVRELVGDGPYLLFLGSIFPRRRLDLALEAFSQIAPDFPDLRFVIAGANRLPSPEALDAWIARSTHPERVHRLGWVAEELLPALLREARALVYLSTYEGYGLPPLEALAAGIPAVTLPGLALDEIWTRYPYRIDSLETSEIATTLRRLLGNDEEYQKVTRRGRELMTEETWHRAADLWLEQIRRGVDDWS